jgi:RNA polymerase sigma-70 factor (ECF subfamily)
MVVMSLALPFPLPCTPARSFAPASVRASAAQEEAIAADADAQNLVAARRGIPSAFEALVRRHQGPIYNFCLRLLGDPEDAADVAQETFVQLYNHLHRLDARDPLAPWLFRVARNRCIDLIRRRRTVPLADPGDAEAESRLNPGALDPIDSQPLPDELVERADLQRLLTRAIQALPPAYAEVVALRYAADRSFAEIAAILDCDEGAARVRFHRAKALLRQQLSADSAP